MKRSPGHVSINEATGEVTGSGSALSYYRAFEAAHTAALPDPASREPEWDAEDVAHWVTYATKIRNAQRRHWVSQATAQAKALVESLEAFDLGES